MFAKCIVILAVIAHINASGCEYDYSSVITPSVSSSQESPVVLIPSGNTLRDCSFSNDITRNLVGKGKYPVTLRNYRPTLDKQIPVIISRVTTPLQEKPTVRLPATIPAPRTICHSCTCYKTIVRPRVHQQIISVPCVKRFLETTHKPVIENIQCEAFPVHRRESGIQFVHVGAGTSNSGLVELVSVRPQIQTVEIPSVQVFQIPQIQTLPSGSCSCQC